MTTVAAPPTAPALPPAGTRRRNLLSTVALLLGVATVMTAGSLVAVYFNLRSLAAAWPPDEISLDNYLGATLLLTVIPGMVTVEWAVAALRRGNRRQALTALVVTAGIAAAYINLVWFTGADAGFGAGDHHFGLMFFAFLAVAGASGLIALIFVLVALARTMGGQATAGSPDVLRGAAWYWHAVAVTWLLAFIALYFFQNA